MTENIETHQPRIQRIRETLVGALGPFEMMADIIVGSQHGPYGSRLFGIVQSPVAPDMRSSSRPSSLFPGTATPSSSSPVSKGSSGKKSYREKESVEPSSPSTSSEANVATEKKRRASSRKDEDDCRRRRKRRKSDSLSKNDGQKDNNDWQKPCSSGLGNKIDNEDSRITMNDLFGEENKFTQRTDKNNDKTTKVKSGDDRKKEEGESPDSGFVDESMDSDKERQTQHLEMENVLEELGHVSPLLSPVRKPSRLPPLVRNGNQRSLKCELNLSLIEAPERERLLNKLYSMEHAVELIPGPQLSPPPRPSSRLSRSPCLKTNSTYISDHTSASNFIKDSNENSIVVNSQTKNVNIYNQSKKKVGKNSPTLHKEVLKKETMDSPRSGDISTKQTENIGKEESKLRNVSPASSTSSVSTACNDSLKDQENDNLTAHPSSFRVKKDEEFKRKIKKSRVDEADRKDDVSDHKKLKVNRGSEWKNDYTKPPDSKRDVGDRLKVEKDRARSKEGSRSDEKRKDKYKDSNRYRSDSRLKDERDEEQVRDDAHTMREENEYERQREDKGRERFRDEKERERRDEKERQRRENDDEGRNRGLKEKLRDTKSAEADKLRVEKEVVKQRRDKDAYRIDEKVEGKRKDKLKSERKDLRDKEKVKPSTTARSKEISGPLNTSTQSKNKLDEKEHVAANSSKSSKKDRDGFVCCADKVEKKKKELEFEDDNSLKPAAFYESKSRPKKHKADEEKDKVLKVLYYFDSVVYFILTAAVNSRNRNANCQMRQFNHIRDIAELLKTATNRFTQSTAEHTSLMSHYIARVKILSLRAQAVLNFQLFSLKTREIYKNVNTLAKFETKYRELEMNARRPEQTPPNSGSQSVQSISGQSALSLGSQSVHSAATPSPASSSHSAGSERTREVTLPLDIFKIQKAQLSYLNHLLWAHLTWDDANAIRGQRERGYLDLVEKLDEVCGNLTIESSLESLSFHLATGVSWLIAEYKLEAGFSTRV